MRLLPILAVLFSLTLMTTTEAQAQTKPEAVVDGFYKALVLTMKKGPQLGFEGRKKKLTPEIKKAFNFPLMTRYAVGSAWRKASKEEQTQLINAFSDFSISTYASRFKKFDGEVFKVLGCTKSTKNSAMVATHLIPKGEEPVKLSYLVRKDKQGKYRISDVYLDDSISELATRRSEFSAVIKQKGISELITMLKKKVSVMKANSTS